MRKMNCNTHFNVLFQLVILFLVLIYSDIAFGYDNALFEPPDGTTYHGVGWYASAQENYSGLFSDSTQPLLFQTMSAIPGSRGRAVTVEGIVNGLQPARFYSDRQFCELGIQFTDNTNAYDSVFAFTDELDSYIDTFAQAIIRHDRPIFLRIGFEMNGNWNGYTPYTYPAAFRKLVDGFRNRGAENFATVWCYEPDAATDFADSTEEGWKWYPGDDYVDWFGLDLFRPDHFDPAEPDSGRGGYSSKGKSELFLRFARERGKPVYLNELSASHVFITPEERDPDSADAIHDWELWFEPFFEFMDIHPEIKAFNYINLDWTQFEQWEHWGDARLEINSYIANRWVAALSDPRYIHIGYDIENPNQNSVEEQFDINISLPGVIKLTAYPNPFNSSTNISFILENNHFINLEIYDILGRRIARLLNDNMTPGAHKISFNGNNLGSGQYFIRLKADRQETINNIILIK
ncbi:MAG: T9SS type A sorting domain-containing protein [Candidatus Electryonea clarkiae]|nr:T9SS type A sorting domain-containing protein [Candidatus Electryonea clarkiae]MDP8287874.1 T9SS type A sorting domain-containing protein [Candidatus Electryonea clarkiae]